MKPRGKHFTVPRGMTPVIRWLESQPDVNRVIFGPYRQGRPGAAVRVIGPCRGGLQLRAGGQDLGMDLFVHTPDPDDLAERVRRRFHRARLA